MKWPLSHSLPYSPILPELCNEHLEIVWLSIKLCKIAGIFERI